MTKLPESWAMAALSSVCERIVDGSHNPPRPSELGRPMLSARNIQSGAIKFDDYRLISEADFILEHRRTQVAPNDVLLTIVGTIGRVAVVPTAIQEFALQRSVAVLKPSTAIIPRYLAYALESPRVQQHFLDTAKGTAQKGIYLKALGALEIELAPQAEQTRIADQLDTLLARVNACNDHLDAIPGILKRFRLAVIRTAMTGGLSDSSAEVLSQEWTTSTIGGVTVDLRYGTSKKCDYGAEGVGVLRIPNITSAGGVSQSDLKFAQFDEQETKKLALKSGDLLVIRSNGSLDLVGRCGLVSEKDEGLLFAGYLMRLRVNTDLVRPAFIMYWLMAADQRKRIELLAKSTSGVNNLNAVELRSLPLRFPTLPEQDEILRKVEAYMACADRIEARYIAMYAQTQRLAPQVLAKAFRGELTEQDPSDEPANALLSRLASKSATSSTEKVPRRPRQPRTTKAPAEASSMTKSRQDEDVKGLPYLAGHLRRLGVPTTAQSLFKEAELPVADFYKQLAWEIAEGHVRDNQTTLEPGNATG